MPDRIASRVDSRFEKNPPPSEKQYSEFTAKKHLEEIHKYLDATVDLPSETIARAITFESSVFHAGILPPTTTEETQIWYWQSSYTHIHDVEKLVKDAWLAGKQKPLQLLDWKKKFHTVGQLEKGDVRVYIDQILPEGICVIGSLSGVAKSWIGISMSKALVSGNKFLGNFSVNDRHHVLYLVPEMGERAFRARCEKFGLQDYENFRCQTISDGVTELNDSCLEAYVVETNPIIFLDTAIRFNPSEDENSSSENASKLAADVFRLLKWGSKAVVCVHHSPKKAGDAEYMTLENMLRGTGDIGAMAEVVWGLQHAKRYDVKNHMDVAYFQESKRTTRVYVECLKPRDLNPAEPFMVQGRPYIDEKGDFVMLAEDTEGFLPDQDDLSLVLGAVKSHLKLSPRQLEERRLVPFAEGKIVSLAREGGYEWVYTKTKRTGSWKPLSQGVFVMKTSEEGEDEKPSGSLPP